MPRKQARHFEQRKVREKSILPKRQEEVWPGYSVSAVPGQDFGISEVVLLLHVFSLVERS